MDKQTPAKNRYELKISDEFWDPLSIDIITKKTGILELGDREVKNRGRESISSLEPSPDPCVPSKGAAEAVLKGCTDRRGEVIQEMQQAMQTIEENPEDDGNDIFEKGEWIEAKKVKPPSRYKSRGAVHGKAGLTYRRQRQFDRQSGSVKSGVKPVVKRNGGGAHNWGFPHDDLEATSEVINDSGPPAIDTASEQKVEIDHSASDTAAEPQMTLDEWKQHEQVSRRVPIYKLRKPGEGEDTSQWAKLFVLKKKPEDEHSFAETSHFLQGRQKRLGKHTGQRGQRPSMSRAKIVQSSEPASPIHAEVPQSQKPAPNVDDLTDFPQLSGP